MVVGRSETEQQPLDPWIFGHITMFAELSKTEWEYICFHFNAIHTKKKYMSPNCLN